MGWIKRNLFFVIGGAVALVLLGAAGYYNYTSWSRNSTAFDNLTKIYNKMKELAPKSGKPGPGNDKVNNTQNAKDQEHQLREWMGQAAKFFQPIAPIPTGSVTEESYTSALRKTIDQLQHEAESANVALQPKYGFSFEAQRIRVTFAPGSLGVLAEQLGEVKSISEILYAARVNSLDSIQRVPVSADDMGQADYINESPVTNNLAVLTPYVVTFRAFSAETAQVLAGFASSPHNFIVKGINVRPAGGGAGSGDAGMSPPPAPTPMPTPVAGKNGLQTVLKEQLLQVILEVDIVKLLPK